MASLEPKKLAISISDAQITDLKDRLARTRLPDQLEGVQWEYGMSKEYLKVNSHRVTQKRQPRALCQYVHLQSVPPQKC